VSAVISLDTQTFLGHNQATYQDLRLALQLNLRRQLLLAVCDDAALQMQLAHRLEADLNRGQAGGLGQGQPPAARGSLSPMVTLYLNTDQPDPVRQVLLWLKQHRLLKASAETIPAFQIVGLEQLTQRSPTLQNQFLASLTYVDALITRLDCRLLIWVPRPWLGKIRQAVPGFWRSRSGSFEFVGDPTPTADRPLSFEITSPPQIPPGRRHPAATQGDASPVKLPQFEPSHRSDQSRLSETAAGSAAKGPTQPPQRAVHSPSDAAPAHAPAPQQQHDAKVTARFAHQFTIVDEAPLTSTILPPAAAGAPTEDFTAALLDEAPPAPVSDNPQGANLLSGVQNFPSPQPLDAPPPQDQQQPASLFIEPLGALPEELATDRAVVALWQYTHTLDAQHAGPMNLARAYLGLGQKSRDRIEAGPVTLPLLDFAIDVYGKAIAGLLEGEENWCDALNDLASLYWLRSQQEETTDGIIPWLQHSIAAYQKALTGTDANTNAETSLRIYSNLGTVYSLLANFDDPSAHLQQSLAAYRQALSYAPAATQPLEYANLHNSLGAAHWRLAQLDQPQHHLRLAIQSYSEALRDRHPQGQSLEYAMIQNNLGIAYWNLAQYESPLPCLENAVTAYQTALKHRTVDTFPHGCAATHNNLGTAYWDLAQQFTRHPDQRLTYLHQSVEAYDNALNAAEVALQADPNQALGFDVWATAHSAGVVHDQLAQGLPADQGKQRQRHLQQALQHYQLAYQGWQDSPQQLEVLVTAFVYNIHLSFEILGLAGQQAVLSQVPGELLPDILRQL
jgi:tetratricopeptide (TPR) repeat protein